MPLPNTFTPFRLEALNKGKLLEEINEDLNKVQADMLAFARRFGGEAEKAKAVLNLKVAVICVDPATQQFAVRVESTITAPKRPADLAVAFANEDDDGNTCIIVRTFGIRPEPEPKLPFDAKTGQDADAPAPAPAKQ